MIIIALGSANRSRMRECAQIGISPCLIAGASDNRGKAPLHSKERHMRKHWKCQGSEIIM